MLNGLKKFKKNVIKYFNKKFKLQDLDNVETKYEKDEKSKCESSNNDVVLYDQNNCQGMGFDIIKHLNGYVSECEGSEDKNFDNFSYSNFSVNNIELQPQNFDYQTSYIPAFSQLFNNSENSTLNPSQNVDLIGSYRLLQEPPNTYEGFEPTYYSTPKDSKCIQ